MSGRVVLAAIVLAVLPAGVGAAHEQHYVAALSGAAEFPPNGSPAAGFVVLTVNLDLAIMRVRADFTGLQGDVTAAHIHGGTDFPLQGLANPATQVPTFLGFPSGVSEGTYDHTFSLGEADTYNPAFIHAAGGTVGEAYNDLVNSLDSATMYFNIHTTAYVEGEIRGFLLPTPTADFDRNGVVDQFDLGPWNAAPWINAAGDANGDFISDGGDFLVWQNQFGAVAGIGAPGHGHGFAVAEPATIPVLAMASVWVAAIGARRRSGALGQASTADCQRFPEICLPNYPASGMIRPLSRFSRWPGSIVAKSHVVSTRFPQEKDPMVRRHLFLAAAIAALAAGQHAALAAVFVYQANMDGPSEFPPQASPGTGFAQVDYDNVARTMRIRANFTGLIGNTTQAHIHSPIPDPPANPLAGVATQLPSFTGFPLGVTSGSMDTTFDLTLASSWNAAYVTAKGGTTALAEAAFFSEMAAGKAYFNVHTSQVPGGEIRGFFALVPEPGAAALLAVAGIALHGVRRRKN